MNRTRITSRLRAPVLAGFAAGVLLVATALPAAAQTSREKELEARVSELERLVQQLLQTSSAQGGAAPSTAPGAIAAVAAAPGAPAQVAAPTAVAAAAGPAPVQASTITPNAAAGTKFLYTGFVKADVLWTEAADGVIPENTSGRDFYVPAATPVFVPTAATPIRSTRSANLDAHVKQSRLIFGTDTPLNGNPKDLLQTRFEVDLFGSSLGDQRTTNTYGLQVRHAYVQWHEWLVGQTWSNFEDPAALPDAVDFIGSTDGTVFVRQPQVRWTRGGLSLSAENTETTLSPFRAATQNARVTSDDSNVPDLVAKYTWKGGWGQVSTAALGRQLKYRGFAASGATSADDTKYTGALALSGKINLGQDDIRFVLAGGNLGRYVGLNFANDAVLTTNGVTGVASLDTIDGYAGFVAWRHPWTKTIRTNLYYATQSYDNDVTLTGGLANKESWSVAANVFYSPLPKLDIGAEFRHAVRELENGMDGSLDRLQLTTKYSF
jgi:hypothetical protein